MMTGIMILQAFLCLIQIVLLMTSPIINPIWAIVTFFCFGVSLFLLAASEL